MSENIMLCSWINRLDICMVELHIRPFYHLVMNSITWQNKMQHKCCAVMNTACQICNFPKNRHTLHILPYVRICIFYARTAFIRLHYLPFAPFFADASFTAAPFLRKFPLRGARVRLFFQFALASYPQYDIIAKQRVPIAQLDRASDSDSEGRRFESFWARHMQKVSARRVLFSLCFHFYDVQFLYNA